MKEIKDLTVLVYGHGLDIPIARRMARDCGRVLYFSDWEEGFSDVEKALIGDGIPQIERVEDIWDVKEEVDLFMFPDIQHSGLQLELEAQGYPVWGSRKADAVELDRELFLEVLAQTGLPVPEYELCVGIDALRDCLKHRQDVFIKISKFRGTLQTEHWRSWALDENLLDLWAVKLGAARHQFRFLVFDPIETDLEIGGDTYCVDGQWPSLMLNGIEWKDKAYLSAVTPREQMPEQTQAVLNAFAPYFAERRMRNQWSCEIRVKGDEFYFIDATPRLGLPSTASQLEIWANYPQIVWAGAHGVLVDPVPNGKFTAELNLSVKRHDNMWPTIEIPEEIDQWVKLADCCQTDNCVAFPEKICDIEHVGWLVAYADTPREVLKKIEGYIEYLPEELDCDPAPLANVIREIEQAAESGVPFTQQEMPLPSEVVENLS